MSLDYLISKKLSFEMIRCKEQSSYSLNPELDQMQEFLKIFSVEQSDVIPEKYINMLSFLDPADGHSSLLPKHVFKQHALSVSERLSRIIKDPKSNSYLKDYLKIKSFLSNFSRATIDRKKTIFLASKQKHQGPKDSILKFLDSNSDLCPSLTYSNSSTSTGRLTVKNGPNILTAPSSIRSCFKSSFKNGRIAQIDVIAAEPKFALHFKGRKNMPLDIYKDVSESVFSNRLSRDQVKIATLCALYGQSPTRLSNILPAGVSATAVISKVKEYFGVSSLKKTLDLKMSSGSLTNYLGRPLHPSDPGLAVNYFLQSSVAESCILMFDNFCKKFTDIKPLFVIHDALIVDIPESLVSKFDNGSLVDLFFRDWKFESKLIFLDNN